MLLALKRFWCYRCIEGLPSQKLLNPQKLLKSTIYAIHVQFSQKCFLYKFGQPNTLNVNFFDDWHDKKYVIFRDSQDLSPFKLLKWYSQTFEHLLD